MLKFGLLKSIIKAGITCFFLLSYCWVSSQNNDEIKSVLESILKLSDDTNKVKSLNEISYKLSFSNPRGGLIFGEKAKNLSEKLNWNKGISISCSYLGANYLALDDNNRALEYLNKALELNKLEDNKIQRAKDLGNVGMIFLKKSNYAKALEYLFKSLKIFEELKNKTGIGNQLSAIGKVYELQKNKTQALHYDSLSLQVFKEANDKEGQAIQLGNLGIIFKSKGQIDKALAYFTEALELYKSIKGFAGMAENMVNIGTVYNASNQFSKALDIILKGYDIYKKLDDKWGMAHSLGNAGMSYQLSIIRKDSSGIINSEIIKGTKNFLNENAISYFNRAYKITSETGDLEYQSFLAKRISDAYILNGNYKDANGFLNKYLELKDSVYTLESNVLIENLTTERELLLKDKQIELDKLAVAKERNERVFLYIGIGLLLIIISFVVRSNIKQRKLNKIIEKEKEKSEDLLLNILPTKIADELKEHGSVKAKQFNNATVMFTDFKDFTSTSGEMNASDLVGEIDYMYSEFDRIVSKYNIEKIKTIGDSYMCASGLSDDTTSSSAVDIVSAALEITAFISNLASERERQSRPEFHIRVGINTGPVVAGIVGIKKFAYDIWGDTVNVAARMEGASEKGRINVSGKIYDIIKDKFNCSYRGKIDAKGKGEIDMYFVDSLK